MLTAESPARRCRAATARAHAYRIVQEGLTNARKHARQPVDGRWSAATAGRARRSRCATRGRLPGAGATAAGTRAPAWSGWPSGAGSRWRGASSSTADRSTAGTSDGVATRGGWLPWPP